jgi:hypothetical protein
VADVILMRRDVPLQPGRRLAIRLTTVYEIALDEDMLQDEPTATVEQIEEWISGTKRGGTSDLAAHLRREGYTFHDVEHTVHLDDVTSGQEEWRFELPWEKDARERGETWHRRSYLDPPEPSHGNSTPGDTPA